MLSFPKLLVVLILTTAYLISFTVIEPNWNLTLLLRLVASSERRGLGTASNLLVSFPPIAQKRLFIALESAFLFTKVSSESLRQSMLQDFDLLFNSSLIVFQDSLMFP